MTTQSTITEELLPVSGPVLVGQVFDDAVSGSVDVSQVAVRDISNKILAIIYEYRLKKFDHSMESNAPGTSSFLAVLDKYVETGRRVQMCLPAFPFKSANKVYKALGPLPDKAEELALKRLHTMCSRIEMVYPPGALLTIISDGLVYSDLLCIPDADVWAYGEALRAMTISMGLTNIGFSRLRDLVTFQGLPKTLNEMTYIANATNFRRHLLNKFGNDTLDIEQELKENPDTLMTYCGYKRFLESDLKYILRGKCGKNEYSRNVAYLAREMIRRGYAFAGAVKARFPEHLRLSIHRSTGEVKISLSLLDDSESTYTTPWHCSVGQKADGKWVSAPKGEFEVDPLFELVYENGRASYFKAKAPVDASAVTPTEY